MRWVALLLTGLILAGCLQQAPPPPRPQLSSALTAYTTEGGDSVEVQVPAAFTGFQVVSVAPGFHGAEPNIGVTPQGSVFASAYETVVRSQDQGVTWEAVHTVQGGQSFDPMLWVDTVTGRVTYLHIYPQRSCNAMAVSTDEGDTWTESPLACPSVIVDHEKLATGPAVGPLASIANRVAAGRLTTLCYNQVGTTWCATSPDGGATFPQVTSLDGPKVGLPLLGPIAGQALGDCGGLNGHQHHAIDGTIYVPYGYACKESRIAVSTDGGFTWTRRNPAQGELELDPEIASTPDGTVYFLYRAADQRLNLLRSHDRFATFEGPFTVSPPDVLGTVFAGLAAGSDGRIAYVFLGSTQHAAGPDLADSSTEWNLYAGMSLDADATSPTFVTVKVTSDPVQRGSICHSKPCHDGNRNLLDFIDLSVGPDGRFWASYTDGCTSDDCKLAGQLNDQTSRDDMLAVAFLKRGPSLFSGTVS